MFGGLEILPLRSISRESYQQCENIPDWCSLAEAEEEKLTVVERSLHNVVSQTTTT